MSGISIRRPLDSAVVRIPVGRVYVIPERCKGCNFYIEFCPEQVLAEAAITHLRECICCADHFLEPGKALQTREVDENAVAAQD